MASKNGTLTIPIPAAATPAAFFDKSVGAFRTLYATVLRDQLIGKVLNRPADKGMFAYDVIAAYPDLEAAYLEACPTPMDFGTMQKSIAKYVDGIPAAVQKTMARNSGLVAGAAGTPASDFVARCRAASEAAPADVPLKNIVAATAVALISAGHMHPTTGAATAALRSASGTPSGSTSSMPLKVTGRVQTRPKANFPAGGKSVEPSPSPAASAAAAFLTVASPTAGGAATVPADPLVSPPHLMLQWLVETLLAPPLALIHSDTLLIADNCCRFNANNPDTTYVDAARTLRDQHAGPAVAAMGSQMQALFSKWWRTSGVWRLITAETAASAPTVEEAVPPSQSTVGKKAAAAASQPTPAAVTPMPSQQQQQAEPPTPAQPEASPAPELLVSQPTRRGLNLASRGQPTNAAAATPSSIAPTPVPSQQLQQPAAAAPSVSASPTPMSLAPVRGPAPPTLKETYPTGTVPTGAAAASAAPQTAAASGTKIQLARMSAFEELRRAEKRRLLGLLAQRQTALGGAAPAATANAVPSTAANSDAHRIAATTAARCPQSLAYAVPERLRIGAVVGHLSAPTDALTEAKRFREAALRAVFGGSDPSDASQKQKQPTPMDEAAAVLFSVFADPAPTTGGASPAADTNVVKPEEGEANAAVATSDKKSASNTLSSSAGAAIFATSAEASALGTLAAFYNKMCASMRKRPAATTSATHGQGEEGVCDTAATNNNSIEVCPAASVSDQILEAYSGVRLAELRELLTLIAGALHKAAAATPVLFYGHELALWYERHAETVVAAAAPNVTSSSPSASTSISFINGLKRERDAAEDEGEGGHGTHSVPTTTTDPASASLPSFWVGDCFGSDAEGAAVRRTAALLSSSVLVRLLLWFPHIVAACARSASSRHVSSNGHLDANATNNGDDEEATAVSQIIAGAVACPLVEQLLAFVDTRQQ